MQLEKELEKWIKGVTKYTTKSYLIQNHSEKRNIQLYYKYEKDDEIVQNQIQTGIGLKETVSQTILDNFLDYSDGKFHSLLSEHIEENWEQDIFDENPNYQDTFDIAYYTPQQQATDQTKSISRLIITNGKRLESQIVSRDPKLNSEEERGEINIIGWSHQ